MLDLGCVMQNKYSEVGVLDLRRAEQVLGGRLEDFRSELRESVQTRRVERAALLLNAIRSNTVFSKKIRDAPRPEQFLLPCGAVSNKIFLNFLVPSGAVSCRVVSPLGSGA